MNKIGFLCADKCGEKRIAILPSQLNEVKHIDKMFFETGYGNALGISDDDFVRAGANINSRNWIMDNCDVICDPKIGDAEYVYSLPSPKILFGYFHAVQNQKLTDSLIENRHTCIAWEDMYNLGGHLFWKNNVLAGEAAIIHAASFYGKSFKNLKAAIIGRGNTSHGVFKALSNFGADVTVFSKNTEKLFKQSFSEYDLICNCVLWDTSRKDHLLSKKDLVEMKKGSMIIDVSCDAGGGIETSKPSSISDPVYIIDDIIHYTVDNTPSIFFHDASYQFGDVINIFLDILIEDNFSSCDILRDATIILNGEIIDYRINEFQNR